MHTEVIMATTPSLGTAHVHRTPVD